MIPVARGKEPKILRAIRQRALARLRQLGTFTSNQGSGVWLAKEAGSMKTPHSIFPVWAKPQS